MTKRWGNFAVKGLNTEPEETFLVEKLNEWKAKQVESCLWLLPQRI